MIRILLVDDQRTVREAIRSCLKPIPDLEVVGSASNGQAAIALVRKLHPDIVLIDMEMPGLDGISATRMILQEFSGVRVIVLSVHDEDSYVAKAVRAGAMGYLVKNTPVHELEAAIRSVHRGYAQIGPGLLQKIITVTAQPLGNNALENPTEKKTSDDKKAPNLGIERFQLRSANALRQKSTLYFAIWLVGNIFLWATSLLYLRFKSPIYLSSWTIALPATVSSTSVNLPDIGQASSENQSPFSSLVSDPRENYKLLVESADVTEPAAKMMGMEAEKFGQPAVKILDNSTLMELTIHGLTPQESKDKAVTLQQALQNKLAELKNIESNEPDKNTLKTINNAQIRLEQTRQKLADYQENSGLNSNVQLENLANSIEQMQVERAQLSTQQQRVQGKLNRLLTELKLTQAQAQDALALTSDHLYGQYLDKYSQIKTEFVNLTGKFFASHPIVVAQQEDLRIAEGAMLGRAAIVLGRSVDLQTLSQLDLNGNGNQFNSQKANILGELVDLQGEQQGLQEQGQELERQMLQLMTRQKKRSRSGSELDRLKKDVQIAEAVYSSTLTKLEIKRTDTSNLYPPISMLTQPNLPKKPSAPKTALILLGSAMGSFFSTTALLSLAWRDRRDRHLLEINNINSNSLNGHNHKVLANSRNRINSKS
jgi:DNA-binding NarL/FixJ family response regulator/uncharacterized protein involved in exopolysaccharide biosynthesis